MGLDDFENRSKEEDHSRIFNYFCSIINLCSDLCLDRNITAIEKIQNVYSFKVCLEILRQEDHNIELRRAFTRLVTTLWIDTEFIKFKFPNRIRIWNDFNINQTLKIEENQIDLFEDIIQIITSILKNITTNNNF